MKKLALLVLVSIVLFSALIACRSAHFRQEGPVDSFAFQAGSNLELTETVAGAIAEKADPKTIQLVVPPGTDLTNLVATLALNTEGTITVISSGSRVVQENSRTANDFSSPVMYAIELPGEDEPWLYRVSVREAETDALLAQIGFADDSVLMPTFDPEVWSYSVEVPYATQSVNINLSGRSRYLRSISIEGTVYRGGSVRAQIDFQSDERTVTIETLAEDGVSSEQYALTILRSEPDRNALLSSLDIPGIDLKPNFDPNQSNYQVTVPYDTERLSLKAITQSPHARVDLESVIVVTGGAQRVGQISGHPTEEGGAVLEFIEGERLRAILHVTAQDDSVRPYGINILRGEPDHDNLLTELAILSADLNPLFQTDRQNYSVEVPYGAFEINLIAKTQSPFAATALQGAPVQAGELTTDEGALVDFTDRDTLSLTVVVTAQDGMTRDYRLDIRRGDPDSNAALALLDPSEGALRPRFSPRTAAYTVHLPSQVSSVQLLALTESPVATVAEADDYGSATAEKTIVVELDPGQGRVVSLIVTAEDGSQRLYRVSVRRAAEQAADEGEGTGPSTGTATGLQPFEGGISIQSKALRLGEREASRLAQGKEQIINQALITIRYYRTDRTLIQEYIPIQVRQQGKTSAISLEYNFGGIRMEPDRLLEVEVAIETSGGGYLHYTEAMMSAPLIELRVPFLLYGSSPRVEWPSVGEKVPINGYLSRTKMVRGEGQNEGQEFERNDKGEYGITVQITDPSGALLIREQIWRRPGLGRGHLFSFARSVQLPEGSTVRYTLTARGRNGRQWKAVGTTRVWTTHIDYDGGYKPASLFVVDDLERI